MVTDRFIGYGSPCHPVYQSERRARTLEDEIDKRTENWLVVWENHSKTIGKWWFSWIISWPLMVNNDVFDSV